MDLLNLRERGQLTIPKPMREALGMPEEGGKLLAYVEDGRLILEPVRAPARDLLGLIGILPRRGAVDVERARHEAQARRGVRRMRAVPARGEDATRAPAHGQEEAAAAEV